MKAYIFSIGESTTELCNWSLQRLGYETVVVSNPETTLHSKLKWLYNHETEDFLRVDADVIVNKKIKDLEPNDNCWWHQAWVWDWYKQDLGVVGVNYIKRDALPYLRRNIDTFVAAERPETEMFRLPEFHNPRRCEVYNIIVGLHGWGNRDLQRVFETKARRGQDYDWQLITKINEHTF